MMIEKIINETKKYSEEDYASWVATLLQVIDGGYGEHDKLLGVRVPNIRKLSKEYANISLQEVEELLQNEYHEIRLLALFIMIIKYKKYKKERETIIGLYLSNADYINNWDLVDMSAPYILGNYLFDNKDKIGLLEELANSKHLWKQRIAIVSTQYFIKHGFYEPTIKLAEKYITHNHHLIHKAAGWMLRELGKKEPDELYAFLDKHHRLMPRVMLRYAIERLDKEERKHYLSF